MQMYGIFCEKQEKRFFLSFFKQKWHNNSREDKNMATIWAIAAQINVSICRILLKIKTE
jgi:hypothetical protein